MTNYKQHYSKHLKWSGTVNKYHGKDIYSNENSKHKYLSGCTNLQQRIIGITFGGTNSCQGPIFDDYCRQFKGAVHETSMSEEKAVSLPPSQKSYHKVEQLQKVPISR